jgi:hypothetical protein
MSDLVVPGYDVVELLGFGSGGEVWLAREHATGAPVALKRLHAGADLAARDRLRREAAALAGVDHPHVLRLRSVVGAEESLVLVLDLATGGSLARLLATRGRLAPGEVVTVAVPLAQALATVHGQGLVHGDVTPANVLFTADGRPVLSDLGVARLLGAPHAGVSGTPGFLDPALARGGQPGPAADVHGLAATCLAALRGSPPYDEAGVLAEGLADGSRLASVLVSALAPDPGDRPRADELAAAVFEAAEALPVRVGPAVTEPHLVRPGAAEPVAPLLTRSVGVGPAPVDPHAPAGEDRAGGPRPGSRWGWARWARWTRWRRGMRGPRTRLGAHRAQARPRRAVLRGAVVALLGAVALAMVVTTGLLVTDRSSVRGDEQRPSVGRAQHPAGSEPDRVRTRSPSPSPAEASGEPGSDPALPLEPAEGPWAETLAALDAARSLAFARADPTRLEAVYAPGAPALGRDRSSLARLSSAGLRADGLRLVAVAVQPLAGQAGSRVRLRVEDVMPAYRLVDRTAALVESRPGRGRLRWTVTLHRVGSRWLVYDVARV